MGSSSYSLTNRGLTNRGWNCEEVKLAFNQGPYLPDGQLETFRAYKTGWRVFGKTGLRITVRLSCFRADIVWTFVASLTIFCLASHTSSSVSMALLMLSWCLSSNLWLGAVSGFGAALYSPRSRFVLFEEVCANLIIFAMDCFTACRKDACAHFCSYPAWLAWS